MSSQTQSGTEWAVCEICETTTDPNADPYGPRSNDDVRVVGEWPDVTLAHGYCLEEGKQVGLEQMMAGGEA